MNHAKHLVVTAILVPECDMDYLRRDFEECHIAEWAAEHGFEAFIVRDGVCFKGEQFIHLDYTDDGYRMMCSVNPNNCSDVWDIPDIKAVEFRR